LVAKNSYGRNNAIGLQRTPTPEKTDDNIRYRLFLRLMKRIKQYIDTIKINVKSVSERIMWE